MEGCFFTNNAESQPAFRNGRRGGSRERTWGHHPELQRTRPQNGIRTFQPGAADQCHQCSASPRAQEHPGLGDPHQVLTSAPYPPGPPQPSELDVGGGVQNKSDSARKTHLSPEAQGEGAISMV